MSNLFGPDRLSAWFADSNDAIRFAAKIDEDTIISSRPLTSLPLPSSGEPGTPTPSAFRAICRLLDPGLYRALSVARRYGTIRDFIVTDLWRRAWSRRSGSALQRMRPLWSQSDGMCVGICDASVERRPSMEATLRASLAATPGKASVAFVDRRIFVDVDTLDVDIGLTRSRILVRKEHVCAEPGMPEFRKYLLSCVEGHVLFPKVYNSLDASFLFDVAKARLSLPDLRSDPLVGSAYRRRLWRKIYASAWVLAGRTKPDAISVYKAGASLAQLAFDSKSIRVARYVGDYLFT